MLLSKTRPPHCVLGSILSLLLKDFFGPFPHHYLSAPNGIIPTPSLLSCPLSFADTHSF